MAVDAPVVPSAIRADIVTVFHNETNKRQAEGLLSALTRHETGGGFRFLTVDNTVTNRGFAAGCNLGALHPDATAPIIGFLNPDVVVNGPFLDPVVRTLTGNVVVTGCRFNKSQRELDAWGVTDWACGAAFFVTRKFFTSVSGFDEQFVWGFEETDLIRQAEANGFRCQSIPLPLHHESPSDNSPSDVTYKNHYFALGGSRFYQKWPAHGRRPVARRSV